MAESSLKQFGSTLAHCALQHAGSVHSHGVPQGFLKSVIGSFGSTIFTSKNGLPHGLPFLWFLCDNLDGLGNHLILMLAPQELQDFAWTLVQSSVRSAFYAIRKSHPGPSSIFLHTKALLAKLWMTRPLDPWLQPFHVHKIMGSHMAAAGMRGSSSGIGSTGRPGGSWAAVVKSPKSEDCRAQRSPKGELAKPFNKNHRKPWLSIAMTIPHNKPSCER